MYLTILLNCFYSFMGSLAFCVLFNIRGKNLIIGSLGGAIAWFIYLILINLHYSVTYSLFMASIGISIYSEILARIMKTPVTTFVTSAMIPLVPGSGMYYTMLETVKGNVNQSLTLGLQTLINAGAIAVAIIFISSLNKLIISFRAKNFIHKKSKGTTSK